jgi:hypothetical protein
MDRLASATSKNVELNFTEEAINNVATVVFYPSVYAKPSMTKFVLKTLPFLV